MPQDPIRYLIGVGVVVGQQNRLSIIAGAAFGNVQRLNGNRVGGELQGGLDTKSVMRVGQFISAVFSIKF